MDYKENWQNSRFGRTSNEEYDAIVSGRLRYTALDRLKQRYKRFVMLGCFMILMLGLMSIGGSFERIYGTGNIWFIIVWMLFFATAAAMDLWLYHGISGINLSRMNVSEVSRLALFYRKRHLQFVAVLLPWALGIVGWLIYIVADNRYMVIGIVAGLLVGLLVGVRQLMEFLKEYKEICNDSN